MEKVNATRMELLRVRKRLDLATRGHKLLKDKLEGLIRQLMDRLEAYKQLRHRVDETWPRIFQRFTLADAESSSTATEEALLQARPRVTVTTRTERLMGVTAHISEATVGEQASTYSLVQTSPHLDEALRELREFLPDLIRLAGLEQTIAALAAEIQRTRRRSNALEYVMIPTLEETQRYITTRLEEMARSDASRLMKVKEMLMERAEGSGTA